MEQINKEQQAEAIKAAADTSKKAKQEVIALVKAGFGVHAIYKKLIKGGFIK